MSKIIYEDCCVVGCDSPGEWCPECLNPYCAEHLQDHMIEDGCLEVLAQDAEEDDA